MMMTMEELDDAFISDIRKMKIFHGVGIDYDVDFRQWWSTKRQSEEPPTPLDFLVNFGIKPDLVQKFLRDVINDCCLSKGEDFPGAGAIDYFAQYHSLQARCLDQKHFVPHDRLREILTKGPGPDAPSEQDTLSLMRISTPFGMNVLEPVFCHCNHSAKFLQVLFKKIPERCLYEPQMEELKVDFPQSENSRKALDLDCVGAIQELLPRIIRFVIQAEQWTADAFMECLCQLLSIMTLRNLDLHVPCTFWKDNSTNTDFSGGDSQPWTIMKTDYDPANNNLQSLNSGLDLLHQMGTSSGITTLGIHFDKKSSGSVATEQYAAAPVVFEFVPLMPSLETLNMFTGTMPLETVAPFLIKAIKRATPKLQSLSIRAASLTEQQSAVLDILDSLQMNSSLKHFCYVQQGDGNTVATTTVYNQKLLEVLRDKSNTGLVQVEFLPQYSSKSSTAVQENIDYFLVLNQYGRGEARDPKTTRAQLVGLLLSFDDELDDLFGPNSKPHNISDFCSCNSDKAISGQEVEEAGPTAAQQQIVNINYALLRECPGTWC